MQLRPAAAARDVLHRDGKDNSPAAKSALSITGFHDLDGLEFVARIDVGTDTDGQEKNEVRSAVTPDHRAYAELMGRVPAPST